MWTDIFLVISNGAFWAPMVLALYRYRWTRAAIFFLIFPVSGTYHLCDSTLNACIFNVSTHHVLDFYLSHVLIILSGLAFIHFTPEYAFIERWCIIAGALLIYLMPLLDPIWTEVIYIAIAFGLALLYAIGYRIITGTFPPYKWSNVWLGLFFTACAIVFFALSSISIYWLWHSLWHISAAIGQCFILQIWAVDEKAKWAAMDAPIAQTAPTIKRYHGLY